MNNNTQTSTTSERESARTASASQLESFCRGEMSAVETYQTAIQHETLKPFVAALEKCRDSHQARVQVLSAQIARISGNVPSSSGVWGTLVNALEEGAVSLGSKTAIAVLEQGEDHGLADYRSDIDKLDPASLAVVRDQVLPAQVETHRIMSELKHALQA